MRKAVTGGLLTPTSLIVHPHEVAIEDVPRGDGIVFFVRDPLARFASGFFSRKRRGAPAHKKQWSESERVAFERFETPDQLAVSLSSENTDTKNAAEEAMNAIEHVRSSYWDWFVNEQVFEQRIADVVFIGQQESLESDFEYLKRMLSWPGGTKLPADPGLSHKGVVGEDRTLSDQARRNLERWYTRDYRFLEICSLWRSSVLALPFRVLYETRAMGRDAFG